MVYTGAPEHTNVHVQIHGQINVKVTYKHTREKPVIVSRCW